MRKKLMTLILSGVLAAGMLTACSLPFGDKEEEQEEEVEDEDIAVVEED